MGDQFFWRDDDGSNTQDFIDAATAKQINIGISGVAVPLEGIDSSIEMDSEGNFVRIIEKPGPGEAPTNLQNASFYLFNKQLFELARTLPANPKRGEYEITDAINAYVAAGNKIIVNEVTGKYMECGSVSGWLAANNAIVK